MLLAAPCPLWVGCQGLLQALEELAEALLDHSGCCCKNSGRWLLSVAMKFGPRKCTGDKLIAGERLAFAVFTLVPADCVIVYRL